MGVMDRLASAIGYPQDISADSVVFTFTVWLETEVFEHYRAALLET